MLFVMLLVVAISSMLASSLPVAVLALTLPVTIAIALDFVLKGTLHDYILADHGADGGGLLFAARLSGSIRRRSPRSRRARKRTR